MECKKLVACSNNKQVVIYELLSKAQNLFNANNETVLAKFIYFAKNMEEVRKKWLESEAKCRELENKLNIEKSMYQRKINELKVDIESHYEKRLQAENKSERLQMEMDKLTKQFEMFKKILNDKNNDDERLTLFSYYQSNQNANNQHNEYSKRYTNRAVEDTGSIISDYTEDDIDLPLDENNLDVCNINYNDSPVKNHAVNMFDHQEAINLPTGPSASSLPHNRRSSNCGRKRNQRQSASLTRNGESRDKKRSRTRSIELANRDKLKEITAITTLKIGENGQPITVTSEIQHNNQDNLKSQHNRINSNSNKMELSFVPPRVKNRKKRPSREFLQRSADESQSIEDSDLFWNGSEAVVEEITSSNQNNNNINNNNFQIMTPIIEAPTPQSSRILNSNYKFTPAHMNTLSTLTPGSSKMLGNQPKSLSSNSVMPLARKYKKSHLFKGQVILNSEMCAHCDKRTKFGKMVMKCRECELVVHTECKDQIQRPCYPAVSFPSQGKVNDYCLDESPFIPPILQMIINEIEQRGLLTHEVGLYRVNGSDSQIKQLKDRLIKRHQVPDLRKIHDVHVLCSFVKDFLNNMTEHLITYDSWYRFAKACDLQNETERIYSLEDAIQDLPEANRDTLSYLMLHLQRISETAECKMPMSNLARVFGQSIVGNSSANLPNVEIINEVKLQHQIVENLIKLPSAFYQSFVDGGSDINNRLFKTNSKTPELMRKSKTAVVLSSVLGPASNIPPAAYQQIQQTQQFIAQQHQQNSRK